MNCKAANDLELPITWYVSYAHVAYDERTINVLHTEYCSEHVRMSKVP